MARLPTSNPDPGSRIVNGVDALLLAAIERGDESLETGRHIVTFAPETVAESRALIESLSLKVADARDFQDRPINMADIGNSEAILLPEIGVALVSNPEFAARGAALAEDGSSPFETVEPEHFMFADDLSDDYLRGFRRAVEALTGEFPGGFVEELDRVEAEALGTTWGLAACGVPTTTLNGSGIRVAVLDTGMALGHPDFAGRLFRTSSFVGQPVQDVNGHGTHCTGTACGPMSPPGTTPRYGIGYRVEPIFIGKVLSNTGSGTTGSVLAGIDWALANRCTVVSMSLSAPVGPQAAYTAAGSAALARGCLLVAAAGNHSRPAGAPANSPTVLSVASLDADLRPSGFSNYGKIDIAAPGRDIFSSWPLPLRYRTLSGTSMAAPHVAGCAALWAQSSPALRGQALWNKLLATARPLPSRPARVGAGLVQAPG